MKRLMSEMLQKRRPEYWSEGKIPYSFPDLSDPDDANYVLSVFGIESDVVAKATLPDDEE